ncbi:helix-turn-helix domain-containing protein [Lutibacter maritimus]|uniref:HTH cro/C1-type domain-containing protein n=1 Tax=Lutibacter maritimus TaxID=593133 RepID=A0A1I6NRB0_9FLAO|nr:hypothetical protein [Lutibacter maritimus]SFS30391.1 hypothetical protein SAMN04488006_0431 [Lutibacter maritimus]
MTGLELRALRKKYGLSRINFADLLNISVHTLDSWEGGKRNIPDLKAEMIQVKLNQQDTFNDVNLMAPKNQFKPEGKLINEEEYPIKEVYIIPVKGRGGLSNVYFADEAIKKLETEKLQVKQMPSNGSKYFKIEVEGISMDDGSKKSLAEGDWAYCRSIPKIYWNSKLHSHKWDIFCFFHNERGIIFKKIKAQDVDNGILTLSSLHPDKKQFPDFKIKLSECSYICNVIKVLSEF